MLSILCERHKAQAIFYSKQQERYKCFQCLLEEQDLIYIDKRFKKEMEEYERIKRYSANVIQKSSGKMHCMRQWKNEIRKVLMAVREQFQRWVEHFTIQFINSLKDIENSKDLKEFKGEDSRLKFQLEQMRDKYMEIMKIFTVISNAPAEQKVSVIEQNRTSMNQIESHIKQQDAFISKQVAKMQNA